MNEQLGGHRLPERPTFAPSSQDWKGSASVRSHKTLFRPRGHAWLLVAAVPGSWISRQAAGACPSGSPFHPSFIPGRHAGWRAFSAHPRSYAGETGNCRASPFWRALESKSSCPSHCAAGAGGSKEAGVCFKTLGLETQPLSLNLSSTSPSPAASLPGDARQQVDRREGADPERSTI